MPRYFFDVRTDDRELRDCTGSPLDDATAADERADAILDAVTREGPGSYAVTVRNEDGAAITTKLLIRAG